jgi:hypothetical protein
MDINLEYAAHQQAVMKASRADNDDDRASQLWRASGIAIRINAFQRQLGAAAACSWSVAQVSVLAPAHDLQGCA